MWYNKYIGIPYVEKGRTIEGTDCWGLVRLIYKNEYNIDLPSFADEYIPKDVAHISELVNQYNEGWEKLDTAYEGVGVLFNIVGHASHMGVMIDSTKFIHSIEGANTSIGDINSPKWKRRLVGFYKYTNKSEKVFTEEPTPLSVAPVTIEIPEGFTVKEALDAISLNNKLPERLKKQLVLFIDGELVTNSSDTVIKAGQKLEYRLLPQGGGSDDLTNFLRIAAVVALVVVAAPVAGALGGAAGATAAAGLGLGVAGTEALIFVGSTLATMATMSIGMALINAIFPVRPPDAPVTPGDPGTSNPQLMLTGGRNESRPYGSIPLVLGQYRIIAPIAANTYSQIDTDTVYLRMLLCWGYGDVRIDDIRIGPTVISEYDEVTQFTDGNTLATDTATFDNIKRIYGTDTTQIYPGTELLYTGTESDWVYRNITEDVTDINVSLYFPEGLRGMYTGGSSAGSVFATPFTGQVQVCRLDDNLNEVGSWLYPNTSIQGREIKLRNSYNEVLGPYHTYYYNQYAVYSAGPHYSWTRIYVLNGTLCTINGPVFLVKEHTTVPYTQLRVGSNQLFTSTFIYIDTLPSLPVGAIPFIDVQTYSSTPTNVDIVDIIKHTTMYNGGDVTDNYNPVDRTLTVSTLWSPTLDSTINYGNSGEEFYLRKDAFSSSIVFNNLPMGKYKVRARRTNSSEAEPTTDVRLFMKCILQAVTGTVGTAPVVIPKDCSLALTALKIKATDQLNGGIEGVNALVTSVCWDYFYNATASAPLTTTAGSNIINTSTGFPTEYIGSTITGNPLIPANTTVVNIEQITNLGGASGFGWTYSYSYKITLSNNATGTGTNTTTMVANHWVKRPTRNPASLFRHVLQHPANAQRILDSEVDAKLDLVALQEWHEYCTINGFKYDAVLVERRSLLEVMKDIAAAGRASPLLVNGKWTVIIDKPRTTVVQQFTPHNSWDFEGVKLLPILPHALRIPFVNSKQEYQAEELVVYNDVIRDISATSVTGNAVIIISYTDSDNINIGDVTVQSAYIPAGKTVISKTTTSITLNSDTGITSGTGSLKINTKYTASNASLYETINLPGITEPDAVYKHARFHLAQSRLRPELYSLNTDAEHVVCTRGDLVRVMHDVPMWGNGSSRIDYCTTDGSSTTIYFRDPIALNAGTQYLIRIRDFSGNNTTHNLPTISTSTEYTNITITPALTTAESESGNLMLIGELTKDSAELIVVSIEPSSNLTAKLTLVDYSPDVYTADTELIPEFNTKITQPAFFARNYITEVPTIDTAHIKSDESVMELSGPNYIYKIKTPFIVAPSLAKNITHIESRVCLTNDTSKSWRNLLLTPVAAPTLYILDVIEGQSYTIQSRYVNNTGYAGQWSASATHTVVGKTTPPAQVQNFTCVPNATAGTLTLQWSPNTEIDVGQYEIRTANSGWGTGGAVYKGKVSNTIVQCAAAGIANTFYIKAIDTGNRYSTNATSVSFTALAPNQVSSAQITYSDTSNTLTELTLDWVIPIVTSFVVKEYKVKVTKPGGIVNNYTVSADLLKMQANWIGTASFEITTVDIDGNLSTPHTFTSTKYLPNDVASYSVTPIGTSLKISWPPVAQTTLPVYGYEIRSSDTGWTTSTTGNSNLIARVTSTNHTITNFALGLNTWYIKALDTDSNYSASTLQVDYTLVVPATPTFGLITFSDTSLTNASVTINWSTVNPAFGLKYYELTYDSQILKVSANTVTLPANWIGDKQFDLVAVDNLDNRSSVRSTTISKLLPNPVSTATFAAQVIDNNVLLSWSYPVKTTLPIAFARVKKGASWATATHIGDIAGTFASIQEIQAGVYTYWISVVDTDNNESTPVSLSAKVSQPPDFIFNAKYTSNFSGTVASGYVHQSGGLLLPVNTTETFADHFTSRTWNSPDDQIVAGYPVFAQPSAGPGYYEEVFDYGNILSSSQVTVTLNGTVISGTPIVAITIGLSDDNITYSSYTGSNQFGTNFRYIKVRVTVSQSDSGHSLYHLQGMTVVLDSKQKTDAGSLSCVSTDTLGSIYNFSSEFIDVASITVTAGSTSPLITVYDFRDSNISGTYSASGTVCTLNEVAHGLIVGQKVRLYFSSGAAINGVYAVESVINANSYTVAMNVIAPTSGSHISYPNSVRIYLYNTSGVRQSGPASCSVRGY